MENKYEIRNVVDLRAVEDSRIIEGEAIKFESESQDLGGFIEVIKRGAITQELIDTCDVRMLYNHQDVNGILARRNKGKGSLDISVDDNGVNFRFKAKNTTLGTEVLESVRNGDLSGCSFAFVLGENGDNWTKRSGGYLREVLQVAEIRDLSIVTTPAYEATSVNTRGLDELKAKEELKSKEELLVIDEQAEEQLKKNKEKEFEDYYNMIRKKYLNK